ncbi:MAG TPA: hypothetical protein DIC19_03000 [Erysipelotrichaceae bacterium]|nr:hypothetical protein [Erysipelotrichaceae bacterium]
MKYPGLGYVGSERISALYGLHETIHDQKSIGIQHFFIDDYKTDLIYSGMTVVTHEDKAYFGDRVKPKAGHPDRHSPKHSSVLDHCIYTDTFCYQHFTKIDRIGAYETLMVTESEIKNTTHSVQAYQCSALLISQPNVKTFIKKYKNQFIVVGENKWYGLIVPNNEVARVSIDAPSGFMYHGIEDILFKKNTYVGPIMDVNPIAFSLSKTLILEPNESFVFKWFIAVGDNEAEIKKQIDRYEDKQYFAEIKNYWTQWLGKSNNSKESKTMLVALKAASLNGFLPADLTGHYFTGGRVCFYVRDALMASRAFIYSNHSIEAKQIVDMLMLCPRKENGEFYQRYTPDLIPDEGANNNVFSQIDVIGYFGRVIDDFQRLYGQWIVDYPNFKMTIDTLLKIDQKDGLYGPEGGVNEGVYGPAFITSTNMFIVGGLIGAIEYANKTKHEADAVRWSKWVKRIMQGIEGNFLEEKYFSYGFVDYQPELIRRYDTPQLLASSLGYPLNSKYKTNFYTLLKIARYFKNGIGYSEQEYHNGPWLFNTAGAAETAYLLGDFETYHALRKWMLHHRNAYGLLPEAIDARNEKNSFINPLMWANAEYVVVENVEIMARLRNEKTHF